MNPVFVFFSTSVQHALLHTTDDLQSTKTKPSVMTIQQVEESGEIGSIIIIQNNHLTEAKTGLTHSNKLADHIKAARLTESQNTTPY